MEQVKRWINEDLERKAFEDIISQTFQRYKDNLMCSQDTMDHIILEVAKEIREQLTGIKREYLTK
jgi:hypothetical protein